MIPKKELIVKLQPRCISALSTQDSEHFVPNLFHILDALHKNGIFLSELFCKEEEEDTAEERALKQEAMKDVKHFYHWCLEVYRAQKDLSWPIGFMDHPEIDYFAHYEETYAKNPQFPLLETLYSIACNHLEALLHGSSLVEPINALVKKYLVEGPLGNRTLPPCSSEFLNTVYEDISSLMEEHKIINEYAAQELKEFNQYEQSSSPEKELRQHSALSFALICLDQKPNRTLQHIDFIKQYAIVDEKHGTITRFTFAPTMDPLILEAQRIERTQTSKDWFHGKVLQEFYYLFKNYEIISQEADKSNDVYHKSRVFEGKRKIDTMTGGTNPQYMRQLQNSLGIVWPLLLEKIAVEVDQAPNASPVIQIIDSQLHPTFIKLNEGINENTLKWMLLTFFFPNGKPNMEHYNWRVIDKDFGPPKKGKERTRFRVYNAVRDFNKDEARLKLNDQDAFIVDKVEETIYLNQDIL